VLALPNRLGPDAGATAVVDAKLESGESGVEPPPLKDVDDILPIAIADVIAAPAIAATIANPPSNLGY
jgi:hypothetical protein